LAPSTSPRSTSNHPPERAENHGKTGTGEHCSPAQAAQCCGSGRKRQAGCLGATLISNLDRAGYAGAIYPINPNREKIGERACLPSVDALPDGVDVAVLAIPRAFVLDTIKGLAARGVGSAIIFAAGFAEDGEAGMAEQAEIGRIAADPAW
jgi:acyl-CoA synthetase (NDP forming)